MSTSFKMRVSLFSLFCVLAMFVAGVTLIFSSPSQNLGTTLNISYKGDSQVTLAFANNSGSQINEDNISIVYNNDETKFKIVGPDTSNVSSITNSSGSELYYFSTNPDVLNTTGYTDPGSTYYLSSKGTSTANSKYDDNGLELVTEQMELTAGTTKEYWYDVPEEEIHLYPAFMTPNNTTGNSSGGANGEVIISHSVTTMPNNAFKSSTTITKCVIPDSVTAIPTYAFYGCSNLTNVEVPNTITSLGTYAFYNCKLLNNINIPQKITTIPDDAFYYCSAFTGEFVIPSGVTSIGSEAFYYCSSLTSITIPDSVTSIGSYSFYYCSSLTSITIPSSVTSIQTASFYYCSSLTSITIPDKVTSIGERAFYQCSNLTSITIGSRVTSIGSDAFSACSKNLESITVSSGNTKYSGAGNCLIDTSTKTLILGCKNSIIPTDGSVTSIGTYAFYGCSSLTSVTIGSGVTSIRNYAFRYCSNLTSVTISDSVTSIGEYAFSNCSSLTSVTIPNSVTSIGIYAFSDCSSLTSVTIGSGVTSIGQAAFRDCSKLTSATFKNTSGWKVSTSESFSSSKSLTDTSLSYTSTAANYLKSTYLFYYWKRS